MTQIYLSPPDMQAPDLKCLLKAFDSNWLAPVGPDLDAFEREVASLIKVPYAVALSSGTAALHLGLEALGVGRGDCVVTSTLTFAATANAITYLGADPVFVDVDRDTWAMDPAVLEEELESLARRGTLPKAVITVDLYGQCADYDRIIRVCNRFSVPVLEDSAEALGATYRGRSAGSFGECAVFSFNGNKIITTSGGGMLVSGRRSIVERARFLAGQARDPAPHYQHSEIGYNYRLSNLLAGLGRGQLQTLDARVTRRREINTTYRGALVGVPGLSFMPEAVYGRSNCWLTCILVDASTFGASREEIRVHLEEADIEARPVWKPLHLQPAFAGSRTRGGDIAAALFEHGLCLPSGSSLTDADLTRVVAGIMTTPRDRRRRHTPKAEQSLQPV